MTIQSNLRAPATLAEIDSSNAQQGAALMPMRALIIGQKTSGGSQAADTFTRVTSADEVATKAGAGSLAHQEALAWFAANPNVNEVWLATVAEPSGGTAAHGLITIASSPPVGTLNLYIAGIKVQVAIESGDSNSDVAANMVTAIQAVPAARGMPVTVAQGSGGAANTVIPTAKGKGVFGNSIDIRFDYAPEDDSPVIPVVTAMASGAGEPDLTALIAALGDQEFHTFVNPYADSTTLTALEAELLRRFQPVPAVQGQMFYGVRADYSTTATAGLARNSAFGCLIPAQGSPTSPWQIAAAVAGIATAQFQADPGLGLQTVAIPFVLAPAPADQWTFDERNLILFDGVATWKVVGGQPVMDRLITTYRLNGASAPDTSYLDATTLYTLMYFRFSLTALLATKFARCKLANDGTIVGPQQRIATPSSVKGECLNWFDDMADLALVEDKGSFKANLVVARDNSNPDRVNVTLPPNLINNLLNIAATIAFIL